MDIWKEYSDYIVGIPTFLIGTLVTFWVFRRQTQKKKLSYLILTNEELLKYSDDLKDKIEVKYENRIINKLYLTVIRITNDGNTPIMKGDFEGNLSIDLGFKPISAEISSRKPKDINANLEKVSSKIEITPCLLNQNDYFSIKILSDKKIENFSVNGRIAGINEIVETPITKPMDAFVYIFLMILLGANVIPGSLVVVFMSDLSYPFKAIILTSIVTVIIYAFYFVTNRLRKTME
jgi:hypothetical protein